MTKDTAAAKLEERVRACRRPAGHVRRGGVVVLLRRVAARRRAGLAGRRGGSRELGRRVRPGARLPSPPHAVLRRGRPALARGLERRARVRARPHLESGRPRAEERGARAPRPPLPSRPRAVGHAALAGRRSAARRPVAGLDRAPERLGRPCRRGGASRASPSRCSRRRPGGRASPSPLRSSSARTRAAGGSRAPGSPACSSSHETERADLRSQGRRPTRTSTAWRSAWVTRPSTRASRRAARSSASRLRVRESSSTSPRPPTRCSAPQPRRRIASLGSRS